MAAIQVFSTPELLEQILSNLAIDRLLLVQRVCYAWKSTISTSPTLQRILFQRADTARPKRDHNPLFEDYFDDIACIDEQSPDAKGKPAQLKISPTAMRRLLHKCPKGLRRMTMFQPPCKYWITLPSASVFDINVKFLNEAHVPVVQAVEKAQLIVELEADKKRMVRRNLERELGGAVSAARSGGRRSFRAGGIAVNT